MQTMSSPDRSARLEVRNPVLALPGMRRLQMLNPETRRLLALVLEDLAKDARERAEKCWRTHKPPMAAYWKAVAVYARHIAKALRRGP